MMVLVSVRGLTPKTLDTTFPTMQHDSILHQHLLKPTHTHTHTSRKRQHWNKLDNKIV